MISKGLFNSALFDFFRTNSETISKVACVLQFKQDLQAMERGIAAGYGIVKG